MRLLKILFLMTIFGFLLTGCSQRESAPAMETDTASERAFTVQFNEPEPLPVPAHVEPKSDKDWEAIANNKNAEIVSVLNIINPVAAYIIAAFDQYGDKLSKMTHEEWEDTQAQLARASAIYEDCKKRMDEKKFDKQLFLDLEDAWQVFVKVGVAGVRTKTMIDAELMQTG